MSLALRQTEPHPCSVILSPMCRRLSDRKAARASRFTARYRSEPRPHSRRASERSARRPRVVSEIGGAPGFRSVRTRTGACRSTIGQNRSKNSVHALVTLSAENTLVQSVLSKSESKSYRLICLNERHSMTRDLKRGRGSSIMARVK